MGDSIMIEKMTMDEVISKLLYVTFNNDYKVTPNIKRILTEEKFFNECFIKPSFDEEIEKALSNSGEEVDDFELNLDKEDLIKKLEKKKEKLGSLESWINSKQSNLYCIRGDAGTGKTTFLHYLKYKYKSLDISWQIIDIQQAIEEFSVLQKRITIPEFNSLFFKVISSILCKLVNSIFKKDYNGKLLGNATKQNILTLVENFKQKFEGFYPREEITAFFDSIICQDSLNQVNDDAFCESCANNMAKWINLILYNELTVVQKFTIILELLVYYEICISNTKCHMIAFDNFERFVGTDEIYDGQLTEFVSSLRGIQQSIVNSNQHIDNVYQIMVFMRNTSVRMFTSQQVTEFFSHDVNISDWFDVSSVLKKKIEWYQKNSIEIEETKNLLNIFNDMGGCGNTLRGLHFKISMLFNYNKRIVIEFLVRILFSKTNQAYIETYMSFWNNDNSVKTSLNKFAARSIIYRLILNALREDGFFVNIVAQTSLDPSGEGSELNSLGYARKILTILYEHDINCIHNAESRYMPLESLVNKLFESNNCALELLINETNEDKLDIIAKVLFFMNYYNARRDNWLQFIDLQYNSCNALKITISDCSDLKKYIKTNYKDIKIRITNAGKAYLYFVVYYFEFFACKSLYKQNQIQLFQNKDMPPLLCAIPTISDIENGDIESFTCVKIIKVVLNESLSCISSLNSNNSRIPFRFKLSEQFILHQQRIVNSHRGFVDNFIEFIRSYYAFEYNVGNNVFKSNFDKLIARLQELRDQYDISYIAKREV